MAVPTHTPAALCPWPGQPEAVTQHDAQPEGFFSAISARIVILPQTQPYEHLTPLI